MSARRGWRAMMVRRDTELIVLTLALGPPIGGVALSAGLAVDSLWRGAALDSIGTFLAIATFFAVSSYSVGLIPAGVNAVATIASSRIVRLGWVRLLLAPVTGGLSGALGVVWLTFQHGVPDTMPSFLIAFMAVAGAVSSLACVAFIERFGSPLPAGKPGATS